MAFISCRSSQKHIAADFMLKNHPILKDYLHSPLYRVEFHDSDVLLQRRALGREYEVMYVISHQRGKNTVDSLILFEVDNRRVVQRVVFPRTPCPLTPLMNAYYPKTLPRVYANTTAERLNYLYTDYAQKTWITVLDTGLCSPLWRKSVMVQKLFIERK